MDDFWDNLVREHEKYEEQAKQRLDGGLLATAQFEPVLDIWESETYYGLLKSWVNKWRSTGGLKYLSASRVTAVCAFLENAYHYYGHEGLSEDEMAGRLSMAVCMLRAAPLFDLVSISPLLGRTGNVYRFDGNAGEWTKAAVTAKKFDSLVYTPTISDLRQLVEKFERELDEVGSQIMRFVTSDVVADLRRHADVGPVGIHNSHQVGMAIEATVAASATDEDDCWPRRYVWCLANRKTAKFILGFDAYGHYPSPPKGVITPTLASYHEAAVYVSEDLPDGELLFGTYASRGVYYVAPYLFPCGETEDFLPSPLIKWGVEYAKVPTVNAKDGYLRIFLEM